MPSGSTNHTNGANSAFFNSNANGSNGQYVANTSAGSGSATNDPTMVHVPGHFLPFEEIYLPPHLMPINPEDEDDVVPDMHAAFGINRAMRQSQGVGGESGAAAQAREPAWRDFALEELVIRGPRAAEGQATTAAAAAGRNRRDGRRAGTMMMR